MTRYNPDSAPLVWPFPRSLVQIRVVRPGYQLLPRAEEKCLYVLWLQALQKQSSIFLHWGKNCLITNSKTIQRELHLLVILYVWSVSHFPLAVCSRRSVRSSSACEGVCAEGWSTQLLAAGAADTVWLRATPNLGFPHCVPPSVISNWFLKFKLLFREKDACIL